VLDVNLGRGTTGFDVARYGRRLNPTIPVIFITGQPQESVDKFGVAGAVMLEKPFDLPSLLSTLREMIEHA
jgi:DNA-binding response OmpR family regulator